jgi:oxygen-independent coproporphyrinogen III oxidase
MPDTSTLALLAKYDQRLPRYTSYPTAPHFTPAVDAAAYRSWLSGLTAGAPISLYLHVPFCAALCWYCGCNTSVVNGNGPIADYAVLLQREIDLVGDLLPQRLSVGSLHWGGGTPTMLQSPDFAAILDRLRARFDIAPDAEISVEFDPRGLTRRRVGQLVGQGVNRASLGVQDFDPAVQRAINRIQPYRQTADVVSWLRAVGIGGINFDLMYGLPLQTVEGVAETADRAAELAPDRIALFGYAHVPWMKRHQNLLPQDALPDMAARFDQAAAAAERLVAHGYVQIGLDHFARPDDPLTRQMVNGRLARNFQGYTTDDSPILLGFGASSIGRLPNGYVQNAADMPSYRRQVSSGELPIARGIGFAGEDRLRAEVIARLMCDLAVDLADVAGRGGEDPALFRDDLVRLQPLVEDGLVVRDGWRIDVTERGRPLVRAVAAAFDAYLDRSEGLRRHSRAI